MEELSETFQQGLLGPSCLALNCGALHMMYSLTEANATRWRCCSLVCTLLRPALVASTHPVTRDLTEARHDVREHG